MGLNRKRFWGGKMDSDKLAAYQTLHTCLSTLALLAHFAFDFKVDVAVCFHSRYFGSSHRFDSCCRGFHALAEHRTKTFEIGVHTLYEHGVVVADHLDILNVDLGSYDRSYRLDICGGRSVARICASSMVSR